MGRPGTAVGLCGRPPGRVLLGLAACLVAASFVQGGTAIRLRDATDAAGIRFVHTDGSSGRRYVVETVSCGLGLIDFDSDGDLDILFLNGSPLPGSEPREPGPTNALYRNNGEGTFTDVTAASGLGVPGYAMGCAVADYDNDGHEDVFITNFGAHRLWRNGGDGTFRDVTAAAGVASASPGPNCCGAGCAFLDYDRDGHLDLFVGNYLQVDLAAAKPCLQANVPVYCSPRSYPPGTPRLFRNLGNGTFRDVSEASGVGRAPGYAMGLVCSDFDGDGWTDIYVGNDVMENHLFRNRQDGTFEQIGLVAGAAVDRYGEAQGTMGSNAGDYDNDGRFDLIVTDYQNQVNTLYRNLGVQHGSLQFQDVTVETGAGTGSRPLVTWGCGLVDFDNDGTRELFTAAGHLQDTVGEYDGSTTYLQRCLLLQMLPAGPESTRRFVDVAADTGPALQRPASSRGAVFGDLNNDGRVDIVLLNARARPTLLINETATATHWTILKLVGTRSNRSAVGAVARVTAGGQTQVDEVRSGRGYQSAEDLRLHFGLGTNTTIDRIELHWPSGLVETRTHLDVDRVLRWTEGEAAAVRAPAI